MHLFFPSLTFYFSVRPFCVTLSFWLEDWNKGNDENNHQGKHLKHRRKSNHEHSWINYFLWRFLLRWNIIYHLEDAVKIQLVMKDEGNRKFVLRQLDFMSKQTLILLVSLVSLYSYKNNNNKVSQNLEKRRSNLEHIKKQRHYFVKKGPPSQGYGLSSGHVWMWELDYKESWAPKN